MKSYVLLEALRLMEFPPMFLSVESFRDMKSIENSRNVQEQRTFSCFKS